MSTSTPELDQTVVTPSDWVPGYELLSVVGAGGFGTVFRARQIRLDRVVAVKVIRLDKAITPALAAQFEAEAVTLGKLHHPNIVEVHDGGGHEGRVYIAMELLDGEDLGQRINRLGGLGERAAWAIARQTAAALAHAAAQGVIHRDIKPANLFLVAAPTGLGLPDDGPLVKVMDFGLALTRRAGPGNLAASAAVAGTPVYMAPEQYRHAAAIDHRADIYALGATVFHAITGRPPFTGSTVGSLMARKRDGGPRLDSGLSRRSAELLAAMMANKPDERIATYDELIARIDRLLAARTRPRWRRWLRAAGLAAVASAIAVGAVAAWESLDRLAQRARPQPAARYEPTGVQVPLFDGNQTWPPPAAGGLWLLDRDEEGDAVLSGTGFTRRTFPPADDYRVTIGLDVHNAAAVELHFGIPAADPDSSCRYVLRVTRGEGATFGTREGDKGAFQPLGPPVAFPATNGFKGSRPYLEVKCERAGGRWSASFNGTEVGHATDDGRPKSPELRLHAKDGDARINSVALTPLRRKD